MIRRSIGMLVALMLVISIASFAFARGAPTKKAFTSKAVVAERVTPQAVTVPAQAGYDVIQNLTEPRVSNTQDVSAVTTGRRRLSSTVDWRSTNARFTVRTARSAPRFRLLR